MGTPERIQKLKVNPDANREALSEAGRAGGLKAAENKRTEKSAEAMWDQVADEKRQQEEQARIESANEHILSPDGEDSSVN